MVYGLALGYVLLAVGTFQLMCGLVVISINAWQRNRALGVITALFWPFTIYWAFGKFKQDPDAPNPVLYITLFFSGLVIMLLSFSILIAFYETYAIVITQNM